MRSLIILLVAVPLLADGLPSESSKSLIDQYLAASQEQRHRLEGSSMEVDIQAELPKLRKKAHLRAIRKIAALGRITYDAIRYDGDKTVRNQVIAKYMSAETEATEPTTSSLAITPENYRFKYKGVRELNSRRAHVFEIKPHKKRTGLFQGELWVDAATYLPLREAGKLVKSPSIFLKKVQFVRDYQIEGDVAFPAKLSTQVDTRIAGKALLDIAYSRHSLANNSSGISATSAGSGFDQ